MLTNIQVDLQRKIVVSGIMTQGDPVEDDWVTEFTIWHSDDCETFSQLENSDGNVAVRNY